MICLDTSFIIDLLRNNREAVVAAQELENEHFITTEINVYELLVGLYKNENHERVRVEREALSELLDRLSVFTLDRRASDQSARISAELSRKGQRVDPPDVLISGIMLANGCSEIITRNTEHFERISSLLVRAY
ncbi:type II toxin-antitoxin system VapC family toxin [Candidatus Woesearchaeota archaeon]|nr:type II toxin-antitoxin system VapC family toxin [Candidatus Woesearchaeota archaeon]